jgi:hypothetical protein
VACRNARCRSGLCQLRVSTSVIAVMSAARLLFPRKRKSIRDLGMSRKCQDEKFTHPDAVSVSVRCSEGLSLKSSSVVMRY